MKKIFSLISLFMLCLCGMAAETETTLLEAYKITPSAEANGVTGSSAELILNMNNRNAIGTWSCKLVLPQGITYVSVAPSNLDDRYPANYNPIIVDTPNNDGSVSFTCSGTDGVALNGQSGAVATVTVNIASTVTPGDYEIYVREILLQEPNGALHPYENNNGETKFTWTIEQGEVGQGTIIFNTNGGTPEIDPITQDVGTAVVAPEPPTKEGYTFAGWEPAIPAEMPAGEYEVTAQWTINQYTLTFFSESTPEAAYATITQDYGTEIVAPNDPVWEGHNFLGWEPDVPETMPAQDMTIEAQWELMSFVVTVIGEGISVSNEYPNWGESVTITVEDKEGYSIVGVMLNNQELLPVVDGQVVIENVSYSFTVEAIYEAIVEFITPTQQYTMFSCDKALDFTDSELKAYVCTSYIKAVNCAALEEIKIVAPGTGVMLVAPMDGTAATTYQIPYVALPAYDAPTNLFKACLQQDWITPYWRSEASDELFVNYALNVQTNDFEPLTDNGAEFPAQSAYLQLPDDQVEEGAPVHFGFLDTSDGIANVLMNAGENAIFDLQGRRVSQAVKGIYIVNGKKVLR